MHNPIVRKLAKAGKPKMDVNCHEIVRKIENLAKTPIKHGARYRVRTCDPYRVKVVLYH